MKTKQKNILIAFALTILILLAAYIGVAFYFNSHFFSGTTINGIDCSRKTTDDVENKLRDEVKNYVLQIDGRNQLTDVITADDIDYEYVADNAVKNLLKAQKPYTWFVSLFKKTSNELQVSIVYDEKKLLKKIDKLKFFQESNITPPVDAQVKYNDSLQKYEIVPEDMGTTLDKKAFLSQVKVAIESGNTYLDSEKASCYLNPKYTSKSSELIALSKKMNQYMDVTITYEFGDRYEICDKNYIQDWLEIDKSLHVSFNLEKVRSYIDSIARIYNTFGKTRDFIDHAGKVIEVSGGDYGWLIDRATETTRLVELIKAGKNVQVEPTYSQSARSRDKNDIGNSYVEIDLTKQHIWVYKDGKLVTESDCVTGNSSKGHDTPTGIYQITYKEHNATLKGENYSSDVTYWMPFYYNVGLHDAPWRKAFGGTIYKRSGSHGCVNLPPSIAEKVYVNIEKGTPVVCYSSQPESKETNSSATTSNERKETTPSSLPENPITGQTQRSNTKTIHNN